jgi:hypothetical protein
MGQLRILLLTVAALAGAAGKQTFTGTITDNMCATAGHARMQMGPTDAECARACADIHGATYVLAAGKNVYGLSDQRAAEKLAGGKVKIVGTLDGKTNTIEVESMAAAK